MVILIGVVMTLIGCTIVAYNKAPVTITDKDSHSVKQSTNARVFDTTISPR